MTRRVPSSAAIGRSSGCAARCPYLARLRLVNGWSLPTVCESAETQTTARKDAVPLLNREKGPAHPIAFVEDVSVQNSQLDKYIAGLEKISEKYDIPMTFYGHAGDGELHIRPYLDLSQSEEADRMQQIAGDVFSLAWSWTDHVAGD